MQPTRSSGSVPQGIVKEEEVLQNEAQRQENGKER